jgi:histidinol-phosphate aminotransferase
MFNLNKLVRKNILELEPYSSARDEFKGNDGIFLDANENPFGEENRYPDPYQKLLKEKLGEFKGVDTKNIFVGNGSDEIIDLAFRIFCNPGKDKALTFSPTYGMYDVSANINDVHLIKLPLDNEFQIDLDTINPFLKNENLKLIFICSPNNPTGNLLDKEDIKVILNEFNGIVIIDEAYIDFSSSDSWMKVIDSHPNLIVLQTFSKAWGLANARVGIAYANRKTIQIFNKVKPPYNVSGNNQLSVIKVLENTAFFNINLLTIKSEKIELEKQIKALSFVQNVYPSDANFLLVQVSDANYIYEELVGKRIIIRNRNKIINNCIRITVGNKNENQQLISALNSIEL